MIFAQVIQRAAELSKIDLLTGIVGEFPSLQGIMGGEYAKHDGEQSRSAKPFEINIYRGAWKRTCPERYMGRWYP